MAFTCFFNTPSGGFTFFEMKSNSKSDSKDILTAYFKTINKTNEKITEGHYTVEDPLYGPLDLIWKGNSIKGIYGPATAEERKEPIEFDYDKFMKMVNIEGNIARNAFASSSSIESPNHKPQFAFDGIYSTRWATQFRDTQWICVDLGKTYEINRIRLLWESAFGKAYQINTSTDSIKWNKAFSTSNGDGRIDDIMIDPAQARYVRLDCLQRATPWGFSIYEFQVFKGNKKISK
jgi:hypothetical protein